MDTLDKYIIVGLGNPGAAYTKTRHNVGFHIVQLLAEKQGAAFKHTSHLIGDVAQVSVHEKKVFLLLPTTFMNSSGDAVRRCVDYYKVPLDHLIVVCDDVALPLGTLRMRTKGSSGGHNGLLSIEEHVNTQFYARLRIGVGGPGSQDLADYVLGRFSEEESKIIEGIESKALEVLKQWMKEGVAAAMQSANSSEDLNKKEK